jgi:hypothetical protein
MTAYQTRLSNFENGSRKPIRFHKWINYFSLIYFFNTLHKSVFFPVLNSSNTYGFFFFQLFLFFFFTFIYMICFIQSITPPKQ